MSTLVTGRDLNLLVCLQCGCPARSSAAQHPRCPRCRALLHSRKPHSLAVTAVLLALAAILYIPANLLPVMYTHTVFDDERDTIMSGVITLLQSGSWPIAVLVFIASIVVPLLKILALSIVVYSAWRPSAGHRQQRSTLYRLVEFIGRWSMLDIYALSLLVTLVQVQSFASIAIGWGAAAFGAVVVLTLAAAHTFDERLLWDRTNE